MDRLARLPFLFANFLVSSLIFVALTLTPTRDALADSDGRAGYSGVARDCATSCHTAGATMPTVTLTGPQSATANVTNTYTLRVTGGPGITAGMNVSTDGGALAATMTGTKMSGAEVVHSSPTPMTGGSATYTFSWTAPASDGTYTIYAAGLSADNMSNRPGDGTAVTSLAVTVTGSTEPPATGANAGGPYTGVIGVPILVDGTASTGSIMSYTWTFGDGTTTSGATASKTFTTAGSFDVILTVIDDKNATSQAVTFATITDPNATDPAGEELYIANCAECHGEGGVGGPDGDVLGVSADQITEAIAVVPEMMFLVDILTEEDIVTIEEYLNPASAGEDLYIENCESCHGVGGVGGPDGDVVGESAQDILDAIADVPEMTYLADVLTEDDVIAIEEFLNSGTEEPVPEPDPGAELYVANCESCHGAEGVGGPDGDVVGEDAGDIWEAIEEYPDAMGFLADVLTEEDVDAIGAYLVSLEGGDEEDDESDDASDDASDDESEESLSPLDGNGKNNGRRGTTKTTSTASLDLLALAVAGGLAAVRRRRR